VWTIVLVLVAGGSFGFYRYRENKIENAIHYETIKLDHGNITAKVTATGTLSAIVTVQVGSQVSGRIAALYADYNSPVKKGQLIAKIDPQLFDAAVEQARANHVASLGNLAKSKAQAVDAQRQYERDKPLAQRKLIAQADLDTAEANYEAAKAQVDASSGAVEQTKAQLHQAEVNLAFTNIVSPTDGVVIARNVDVGQTVAASLQAPTLFLIAQDLSKMQVDTSVAEADIGKLSAGMTATFTVDAYTNERFTGKVRQVRNAPQTVQNVVTYDAVIDVDNGELKLKPGMTANCTFVYAERDNVLRIPNAALRFRPPEELLAQLRANRSQWHRSSEQGQSGQQNWQQRRGGGGEYASFGGGGRSFSGEFGSHNSDRKMVWVLTEKGPRPMRIRTGVSDGSMTEIVDGDINENSQVITDMSGPSLDNTTTPQSRQQTPGFRRIF